MIASDPDLPRVDIYSEPLIGMPGKSVLLEPKSAAILRIFLAHFRAALRFGNSVQRNTPDCGELRKTNVAYTVTRFSVE